MNFGQALEALKKGKHLKRSGWNGKGIFIALQKPDEHSKMTHSYIYIDTTGLVTINPDAPKDRVPWLASQTDLLADDWDLCIDDTSNYCFYVSTIEDLKNATEKAIEGDTMYLSLTLFPDLKANQYIMKRSKWRENKYDN